MYQHESHANNVMADAIPQTINREISPEQIK